MRIAVLILLASVFLAGCGAKSAVTLGDRQACIASKDVFVEQVRVHQNVGSGSFTYGTKLRQDIVNYFKENNVNGFRLHTEKPESPHLRLITEIMSYNEGSRAARYFTGGISGKGELEVKFVLLREDDGFVAECIVYDSVSIGFFGGNFDGTRSNLIEEFAEFMEKECRPSPA